MKVQSAVIKETANTAIGVAVCFVLVNIGFLVFGAFNYAVPLGALVGGACAVFCFFYLGLTVQRIVALDGDEAQKLKTGKRMMRTSYMIRLAVMAAIFILAAKISLLNWLAVAIMLVSPRIVIGAKHILDAIFKKDVTKSE